MEKPSVQTSLSNAPIFEFNPFMENPELTELKAIGRVTRSKAQTGEVFKPETGEAMGKVDGYYSRKEVEAEQFIKLYLQGTGRLSHLTSSGLAMFKALYVLMLPQHGKDKVAITHELAKKRFGITTGMYFRGMTDLIHAGFIAKTDIAPFFWINPQCMFNGDRLRFVQDYDRKETRAELIAAGMISPRRTRPPLTLKGKANDPAQSDVEGHIAQEVEQEKGP